MSSSVSFLPYALVLSWCRFYLIVAILSRGRTHFWGEQQMPVLFCITQSGPNSNRQGLIVFLCPVNTESILILLAM